MKDKLSICAIFRDEASYLDEWLTFHSYVGVDRFYLYNDRSSDNYLEVLKPWIASGRVILLNASGNSQIQCYNHCLNNVRFHTKWLAYIDLDEFLWSPTQKPLPELLEDYVDYSGVTVRWVLFGSSGIKEKPTSGAIENFTRCLPLDADVSVEEELAREKKDTMGRTDTGAFFQGKSIINPRMVAEMRVHRPNRIVVPLVDENYLSWENARRPYEDRWSSVSGEKFRINHYWSRSLDELAAKANRKLTTGWGQSTAAYRYFAREKDLNALEDRSIIPTWRDAKYSRPHFLSPP